jgi:hypothetical protein
MVTRYVNTASTTGGDGTTNEITGATRAFVSLKAAMDSLPETLADATTIYCEGTTADTTSLSGCWNHYSTATKYLLITVAAGKRHRGYYDTAAYRIELTNDDGIYNNYCAHVRLEWLQVKLTSTTSGDTFDCFRLATANNSGTTVDHRFINCIAKLVRPSGTTTVRGFEDSDPGIVNGTVRRINCIVDGRGTGTSGGYSGFVSDESAWAGDHIGNYNCTAYGTEYPFMGLQIIVNCIGAAAAAGAGYAFLSVGTTGHYNNATDDDSATGTDSHINHTFTFVNAAGGDFHLQAADVGAKDLGLSDPLSGFYSDDIDGVARSGTWDIGADEYVAAAATTNTVRMII